MYHYYVFIWLVLLTCIQGIIVGKNPEVGNCVQDSKGCKCQANGQALVCCNLMDIKQDLSQCSHPTGDFKYLVISSSPGLKGSLDLREFKEVVDLQSLVEIKVSRTSLSRLVVCNSSEECNRMRNLKALDVSHNRLSHVEAKYLPSLEHIYLEGTIVLQTAPQLH